MQRQKKLNLNKNAQSVQRRDDYLQVQLLNAPDKDLRARHYRSASRSESSNDSRALVQKYESEDGFI